jgi:hypothetical protein
LRLPALRRFTEDTRSVSEVDCGYFWLLNSGIDLTIFGKNEAIFGKNSR